ncbi:MAG: FAD binding domain-containing protein, partial [Proteobacteria bacterium]|nr:FAD binding domain-containing protein [Pseudomonadota bacterium]
MALVKLKEFCIPTSIDAVAACIAKYGDNALVLGGGSFIHGLEARGLLSEVEALIDIRKLGLAGLAITGEGVRIGAMTTFAALEKIPDLGTATWLGALKDALCYPPLQIKNVATVGGCIAASCPFFDIPTALLALDARLTVSGAGAKREIGLADLFAGLFENSLEPGELITEVKLSKPSGRAASAFIKLEGTANDLAIINVAVRIVVDTGGVCQEARIALGGGIGDNVVRSVSAEKLLQGQRLTEDL